MNRKKTAIAGFGCAGYHAVKAMREHGYDGIIDIYTDTDWAPGNPMLTTYYIFGKLSKEATMPFGTMKEISEQYDCRIVEKPVSKVLSETKELLFADQTTERYDQILIATGASALIPPIPGADQEQVYAMRTIRDAEALKPELEKGTIRSAVVVGASMVGIKLIELLHARNITCTLADMAPHIFPVSAVPEVSDEIERRLQEKGIRLAFSKALAAIEKTDQGLEVVFKDGERIPCDAVMMCIGTRANTQVADEKIRKQRGIVVDTGMRTSAEGIFSAGDCCEGINLQNGQTQIIGIWDNAARQGETAGINMAGGEAEFKGNILHNITHFMGMDFIGYGDVRAEGTDYFYENKKKGQMFTVRMQGGKPVCMNLLDSYEASGVLKAYMMSRLDNGTPAFSAAAKVRMKKEEIPEELIRLLTEVDDGGKECVR